ncbi:MAG TPA: alpha/beta fold hydrolase [Longimicrobium sp.]|nr:alpha/beta fold hydrolase [Longimicrobium sp.]
MRTRSRPNWSRASDTTWQTSLPVAMKQLGALRAYDASERLGTLAAIPTLVMSAAHDPIAPPQYGRALADAIPGARYLEFEDASHGLPIQHAERVNQLLLDHLRGAERTRTITAVR